MNSTRTEFQKTIPELNRLGPTFRLVENGQPHQVIVINSDGIGCKEDGPGSYSLMEDGTRRIVINPTCTQGNPELRTAFMHEVGHSLGMMHILRRAGDTADYITPTTSYGFAVMNPYITYADSEHDTATPTDEIQSLDIREFIRIRH